MPRHPSDLPPNTTEETTIGLPPYRQLNAGQAAIASTPRVEIGSAAEHVDAMVGAVLADRYKLVRLIGEGGMGLVYEARHLVIDKRVAIKVLAQDLCNQPTQVERFLREARTTSKIEHENIVEIIDFGATPNGSVFFAMEFLQGEDLGVMLAREGPQPWERARHMMLQICGALAAAHARGVVHRDLKPQNCFRMRRHGDPDFIKMLDFGIAKLLGEEHQSGKKLTRSGQIFGTPEYMSPEQVRGLPADPRMDIYAAGVIFFELLTGRAPYEGGPPLEILTRHLRDPVPSASTARNGPPIPAEVDTIIHRALAKDVGARFQTADEFAAAIRSIVHASTERLGISPDLKTAFGIVAPQASVLRNRARPQSRSRPRPHRAAFAAAVLMFGAAAAIVLISLGARLGRSLDESPEGTEVGAPHQQSQDDRKAQPTALAPGRSDPKPSPVEEREPSEARGSAAAPPKPVDSSDAPAVPETDPASAATSASGVAEEARPATRSPTKPAVVKWHADDAEKFILEHANLRSCKRRADGDWSSGVTVKLNLKIKGKRAAVKAFSPDGPSIAECVKKQVEALTFPKDVVSGALTIGLKRP